MPLLVNILVRLGKYVSFTAILSFIFILAASTISLAHDGPHVTVRTGDTLSQIAKIHGFDLATFMRINNLRNANHIYVGQQLAIPVASTLSASSAIASMDSPSTQPSAKWQPYIVKAGDSLSVLASDYRVGIARLAEYNRLSPAQDLYVGQVLLMPLGASSNESHALRDASVPNAASSNDDVVASSPVHFVRPGEHLGTIAQQYGTTPFAIAQTNYLPNASHVIPGQRLVIPTSEGDPNKDKVAADAESPHSDSHYPTTTEKWIDVNLTTQTVIAYEGTVPVATFLVSTGLPWTPTVQGTFRIWATTPIQDMYSLSRSGGAEQIGAADNLPREEYDYYIDDVEWVQYFHKDYAFHAAYWHNNFGQPMSRGCINMRTEDAKWLFEWASPDANASSWTFYSGYNQGTLVSVHE